MNDSLHHHIVSEHKSYRLESQTARVSVRKDRGMYTVRVWDKFYKKRSATPYKTLEGALIAAECVRRFYL